MTNPLFKQENKDWLSMHRHVMWVLFIFCCLLYANTLSHQFTLDDVLVLTENKYVKSGDLWSILSKDTFAGFFTSSENGQLVPGGRYRPLTLIIFSGIWSLTESPVVFHAINILTYALTSVLIYQLLLLLFEHNLNKTNQKLLAFLTTVLFIIHPIHTEVVNNIKAFDDLLSLLLAVICWKALFSPVFKNNLINGTFIIIIMFLGLLSKESAVVIIPIAGLSVWFFKRQTLFKALWAVLPMVIALSLYLILRSAVIDTNHAVQFVPELMNNPFLYWNEQQWLPLPLDKHTATVIFVLGMYLSKSVFPISLSHDYYPHAIAVVDFSNWLVWVSVFVHIVLLIYTMIGLYKRQMPAFGLAIYFISLSLFANVFFNIGTSMAERFLLIPSLGICLLIGWVFLQLIEKFKQFFLKQLVIKSALVAICLCAIILTFQRAQDWHNNLNLFEADITKAPNSAKLNNALGGELSKSSQLIGIKNTSLERTQLDRSLNYLNRAIELHPTYAMPHLMKGNTLHYLGKNQLALESYQRALALKPGYPAALENSEKVKKNMELLKLQKQAIEQEQKAIQLSQSGDHKTAIKLFSELIEQSPTAKILYFRGVAFAQTKNFAQALVDFEAAERLTDIKDHENMTRIYQALISTYQQLDQNNKVDEYLKKITELK